MKKILTSLLLAITMAMPAAIHATAVSAAPVDPLNDVCKRVNANSSTNPSPCQDKNLNGGNPLYGPDGLLTKVVDIITIIVGLAAVLSIIYAGLRFITSGDNAEQVGQAREYVQYALIGLVLAAAAQLMVRMVLFKLF